MKNDVTADVFNTHDFHNTVNEIRKFIKVCNKKFELQKFFFFFAEHALSVMIFMMIDYFDEHHSTIFIANQVQKFSLHEKEISVMTFNTELFSDN